MFEFEKGRRSLDESPGITGQGFWTFVDGVLLYYGADNLFRNAFKRLHFYIRGKMKIIMFRRFFNFRFSILGSDSLVLHTRVDSGQLDERTDSKCNFT